MRRTGSETPRNDRSFHGRTNRHREVKGQLDMLAANAAKAVLRVSEEQRKGSNGQRRSSAA